MEIPIIQALRRTGDLLAASKDSVWAPSSAAEIGAELATITSAIEAGREVDRDGLRMLFLPTGAVQDISITNGWGEEMLRLAEVVDRYVNCRCVTPPIDHRDFVKTEIGIDQTKGRFADVAIDRCRHCGALWLVYHHELEAFSKSGRWYRGLITAAQAKGATAGHALRILAGLGWHLYGGSYYDSTGKRSDAPLDVE